MSKPRVIVASLLAVAIWAAAGGGAYMAHRYRVQLMPLPRHANPPVPHLQKDGTVELSMPNGNLVGIVGRYSSELTAYLRFDYLKSVKALAGFRLLVRSSVTPDYSLYRIYVVLPNKLLAETNRLAELQIEGNIPYSELSSPPTSQIKDWARQTPGFDQLYKGPVHRPLLQFPTGPLTSAVARFVLFKTRTDPRVRLHLVAPDKVLSPPESRRFARDMIDVAKFYHIPLSMFIGVGAMENNFVDVRGDLQHAVWTRHWRRGDIVLRRRHGWYLIRDYSLGPWQITQSTLRYAHALYLRDTRDYSRLPARLRPPKKLDFKHVSTPVLTTYAGLLLSHLLTRFHGNRHKAAGAYNGGDGKPNMKYAQGVFLVADYAHRVIGHAVLREQARKKERLQQQQQQQQAKPQEDGPMPPPFRPLNLSLLRGAQKQHAGAPQPW